MNDKKSFWNRWAGAYDGFMHSNLALYDHIADEMKQCLTPKLDVLELACGTGMVTERIMNDVHTLIATDYSPNMIEQAQKKPHPDHVRFEVQDAMNLSYPDGQFDAVLIANALHIVPEPKRIMAEIKRVLRPGGLIIAPTFIHGDGVGFRLRLKLMQLVGFRTEHKWTQAQFEDFVQSCGFEPQRTLTLGSSIAPLCYLEARKGRM